MKYEKVKNINVNINENENWILNTKFQTFYISLTNFVSIIYAKLRVEVEILLSPERPRYVLFVIIINILLS